MFLGIVLWEVLTREDPYSGMPPFQVVLAVGTKGLRPGKAFYNLLRFHIPDRGLSSSVYSSPYFSHTLSSFADVPSKCPAVWVELMKNCWDEEPDHRPSFDQIMERIDLI